MKFLKIKASSGGENPNRAFDFQSTGVVSFDLEVANQVPIEISADVTSTNLSNLAIALNKVSAKPVLWLLPPLIKPE